MPARANVPALAAAAAAAIAILIIAVFRLPAPAQGPGDVGEIVDRLDRLFRSRDSYADLEMRIETPNWTRTLRMDVWTEGLERTFVRVKYPPKEEGMSTLRTGNEMWNFFPKINKVMKVPPSMMMSSWMGSDFTNDDLVKESSLKRDYTAALVSPEGASPEHYYLELVPMEDSPIVWGRIVFTVRRADDIPVREEFYDEKGELKRVMEFRDIKELGGRRIPAVLELRPLSREGHRTVVTYRDARFDAGLPPGTFTLRNLRQGG